MPSSRLRILTLERGDGWFPVESRCGAGCGMGLVGHGDEFEGEHGVHAGEAFEDEGGAGGGLGGIEEIEADFSGSFQKSIREGI